MNGLGLKQITLTLPTRATRFGEPLNQHGGWLLCSYSPAKSQNAFGLAIPL